MKRNYFIRLLAPEGDGGTGGSGDGGVNPGGTGGGTILGQKQAGEEPWFKVLPDELKTPYVTQARDLSAFVKSAVDTKSLVGANTIRLPGDKATPAEITEFYTKLGRPENPEGYAYKVTPVDEKLLDTDTLTAMRKVFHDKGVTTAQGEAILDAFISRANEQVTASRTASTQEFEASTALLKREWGDAYTANVRTAQLAVSELGGEDVFAVIESAGLGNNPAILKFLHKIGTTLLDDKVVGGAGNQFSGTAEGALAEIRALSADTEFQAALNSKVHAGHAAAVDRWLKLHQTAYPTKKE